MEYEHISTERIEARGRLVILVYRFLRRKINKKLDKLIKIVYNIIKENK